VVIIAGALALVGLRGVDPPPTPLHPSFGRGTEIVLVHGLASSAEHWLPTARALARDHRVRLVQLPGHGASDMPQPFSLDRAVEGLDQALREGSSGRNEGSSGRNEGSSGPRSAAPVVLVGHSIGGLVAVAEALEHPERVSALVLVETSLKPLGTPEERAAMAKQLDTDYLGLLRRVYTSFGRDSLQGERLYADAAREDPANMRRWIRLALTADLSAAAAQLRMPVLVILTEGSWPVGTPWETVAAEFGYAGVPTVTSRRISNVGHFIMLDEPATLARMIEDFVSDSPPDLLAAR
jgi:pimeloyl-ACP methyl ester carboxylesterase